MKRRIESQPPRSRPLSSPSFEPVPKEIKIALMEDHRWKLTDMDREIILRLKRQNLADDSDDSDSDEMVPAANLTVARDSPKPLAEDSSDDNSIFFGSNSNITVIHVSSSNPLEQAEQTVVASEVIDEIIPVASESGAATIDEIIPVASESGAAAIDEIIPVASESGAAAIDEVIPVESESGAAAIDEIIPVANEEAAPTIDEIIPVANKNEAAATAESARISVSQVDHPLLEQSPIHEFDRFRIMIDYIVKVPRLFFCYEAITWNELRDTHDDIRAEHSSEDLRDMFIMRLLPKVYTFNLPEATKRAFDILRILSSFERIPSGYIVKPLEKYKASNMPLTRDVDYTVIDAVKTAVGSCEPVQPQMNDPEASTSKKFVLDTRKSNPAPPHIAVVVNNTDFFETGRSERSTEGTDINMAIGSALVSYDYELFHSISHPPMVILERLRQFQQQYSRTGRLPENFNAQQLRKKMEQFMKLKQAIIDITDDRFAMNSTNTEDNQ